MEEKTVACTLDGECLFGRDSVEGINKNYIEIIPIVYISQNRDKLIE